MYNGMEKAQKSLGNKNNSEQNFREKEKIN
jgi:hypothetical protein